MVDGSSFLLLIALGEQALDGLQDLRDSERLLDVLLDAVVVLEILRDPPAAVHRADHDDRDLPVFVAPLDPAGDVEAMELRQHRVEDDQVGRVLLHHPEREEPPVRLDDAVPLVGQKTL